MDLETYFQAYPEYWEMLAVFVDEVSLAIENEMNAITAGIASTYGLDYSINYTREFIPLINNE